MTIVANALLRCRSQISSLKMRSADASLCVCVCVCVCVCESICVCIFIAAPSRTNRMMATAA